ncbi:M1 family metallopeptidase [Blastopirellula sp. J2-11]|uniref:M1 family metallopeptidase n=1 Tax=Blastopirellula sp. J2-11 TaxID=2943192 RepID=UPI0021C67888|nr:M1 family metallopeptidase [Blastopirellula sp. J2-11]UUO04863.1 M1 family metallopeptidase [Blastopirellula sp. J2-11]
MTHRLLALGVFSLFLGVFSALAADAGEEYRVCRYCGDAHDARRMFGVDLEGDGRRYAPIRQVDVLHIKLDVTPNFSKRTVECVTTIQFVPLRQPLRELKLDAMELTIDRVRGSAEISDFASTKKELTIAFAEPIPVGEEAFVEIAHHSQPTGGFYFRTPEMGYPADDIHCWTQGESHFARQWFPCFDYPNERSTTEVICRVPPTMTVVSNGRQIGDEVDAQSGLRVVHWLHDKPHVNYLICLVAGNLEKLEKMSGDVPLGFYTQPSWKEHAENSFADTADIMDFYQKEIGVPYPWPKYDQVTIADFLAGGMENTTITTLTDGTIYADETENVKTSHGLDAHELAHQWFGDYVTCVDWSHLWLNEGFATYYTHLYEGKKSGRDAMLYGLYRDATGRILTQTSDKKPIVWNQYKNSGQQFDYRAYPKGSWVLHMLRNQLGEDLFRACVKTYLERNALSSVATPALQSTIEEVSGRSFDQFFDQWVYHARFPDLKITYRWLPHEKLAHLTLEQTHETNDAVLLYAFPATFRFDSNSGSVSRTFRADGKKQEWFVPLDEKPEVVRFDPDYALLARVTFEKPNEMLFAQLKNQEDMVGRLRAIEQLEKKKSDDVVAALTTALQTDSFYGVRKEATQALQKIHNDKAFDALLASTEQSDARVRLEVIEALGRFYRPMQVNEFVEMVRSESNPAIQAALVRSLGKYHDEAVDGLLLELLKSNTFRNELLSAAIDAINARRDSSMASVLMETIKTRRGDFTTSGLASALTTLARISEDQDDTAAQRKLLLAQLSDLRSPVRKGALQALGLLGDVEALSVLETFAASAAEKESEAAAKKAIEELRAEKPAAPRELSELRKLIDELKKQNEKLTEDVNTLKKKVEAKAK